MSKTIYVKEQATILRAARGKRIKTDNTYAVIDDFNRI